MNEKKVLKILYVIHDNKKGGAAISFLDMLDRIRKDNEVFVIVPHKNGYLTHELDKRGVKYMSAHYFWWFVEKPSSKAMQTFKKIIYTILTKVNEYDAARIVKSLQTENFDLVHTNSSVVDFGAILAEKMNLPHVWHIREVVKELDFLPVYRESVIYAYMKEHANVMIAISAAVAEKMKQLTQCNKIEVVYNGMTESNTIMKTRFPKRGEKISFLSTGNICREKGQLTIVRAIDELVSRGETNFHVFFAGRGRVKEISQLIAKSNLASYVTFLGQVDDMKRLRNKTDVEIVATKWEAFGRATVEAMQASNPVIGTNLGGTTELIIQNKNGFLFEWDDYRTLAEYMKIFISNPEKIGIMGKAAYQSVMGKFTSEENEIKIQEIYERVVKYGK